MTAPTPPPRLAEVDDLAKWPGVTVDLTDATVQASAEFVLDAASAFIRLESGDPTRWSDPATIPPAIRAVCVMVAAKVLRNPDCSSMMVTGPFTEQFAQGVEDALYLSDGMRRTIGQAVAGQATPGVTPGLWTQGLTKVDDPSAPSTGYFDCWSGETIPGSPYPDGSFLWGGAP